MFDAIEDFSIDIGSLLGTHTAYVGFTGDAGAGGRARIFSTGFSQYGDVAGHLRGRPWKGAHGCGANVPQCGVSLALLVIGTFTVWFPDAHACTHGGCIA